MTNGTLTLANTTRFKINNTGTALGNGSYKVISKSTGGLVAGTVPVSVELGGNGMGSGGIATLALVGGELYLNVSGIVTVNTSSTAITNTVTGGNLNLSWPSDHTGWRLLIQTNHFASGLSLNPNDWDTVAGSMNTNMVSIPIIKGIRQSSSVWYIRKFQAGRLRCPFQTTGFFSPKFLL